MYKYLTTILGCIILASFVFLHTGLALSEQPPPYFTTSFSGGDIAIHKDDQKFREDWQLRDDEFLGGLDHLVLRYPLDNDWLFKADIKTLPGQRDHKLSFEISKEDLFYARFHYERFPHYYDNSGGVFKPFETPFFVIGAEPSTDRENLLLEMGLTIPDLPVFTFSYEKRNIDGELSSLTWGEASEGGVDRHIVPTIKEVDDNSDIIKVGLKYKHDIANVEVEQRWEFTDLDTARTENNFTDGMPNAADASVLDTKDFCYDSSQTTVKIDKAINKNLHIFAGYRYNNIDNDSSTILRTFNSAGVINPGGFRKNWFGADSDSDVNFHLWNFNIRGKPIKDLAVLGRLRVKSVHRSSVARFNNDTTPPFDYSPDQMHDITARTNDISVSASIRASYKRIKRIAPYIEVGWQDEDTTIKEKENITDFFQRETDANFDKKTFTVGTNFSPFKRFNGSIQYRKELSDNDYNDDIDTESPTGNVPGGYSAFINEQDTDIDVYTTRVTFRPINSVSANFRYEFRGQEIESEMDNLRRELASVDKQTFSGSLTVTPFSNLYLTSMVMHQNLRVKTRARNDASAPTRAFEGDSNTFVNSLIFALNEKTELSADYQVSLTDNYDDINSIGLPLEHDYALQRLILGVKYEIKKNATIWGKYGLHDFGESHKGDIDNYTDQLFAAGVEIRWF